MKNKIYIIFLLLHLISKAQGQCININGDFESGILAAWNIYTGPNMGGSLSIDLSSFVPYGDPLYQMGQHKIMTSAFDPYLILPTPIYMPVVNEGKFSMRLNSDTTGNPIYHDNGGMASIASYDFFPYSDLIFRYALVAEQSSHFVHEKPFFKYWISTTNDLAHSADPANLIYSNLIENSGYDLKAASTYSFKGWTDVCLDPYVTGRGKNGKLTLYVMASNCNQTGHFGYAYIDFFCQSSPIPSFTFPKTFCSIGTCIVDPSASSNYNDYIWGMQKLYSTDPHDSIVGTYRSWEWDNSVAPVVSLGAFYPSAEFTEGYYLITLKVRKCDSWVSQSAVVQFKKPELNCSPNQYFCCGESPSSVTLSANTVFYPSSSMGTFEWYDRIGTYLGGGTISSTTSGVTSTITVPCAPHNEKFRVKYTTPDGCSNEKWIYVMVLQSPTIIFNTTCIDLAPCIEKRLTAVVSGTICGPLFAHADDFNALAQAVPCTYLWSTGSTANGIIGTPGATYTVTVNSMCGTTVASYTIPITTGYSGPLPSSSDLSFTSGVIFGTGHFKIWGLGSFSSFPAYNAYHYTLRVYDLFGELIYKSTDEDSYTCDGFNNGAISWDGVGNQGSHIGTNPGVTTVYNFFLQLQNCDDQSDYTGVATTPWGTGGSTLSGNFTLVF